MLLKVWMPWNNLGCLGFKVGRWLYVDFFLKPYFGMFVCRYGRQRIWINLRQFRVNKRIIG